MERELKIGGVYRHFKGSNMIYEVLAEAIHSETREKMVIYKYLYDKDEIKKGTIIARPKEMFMSKVPDGRDNPNNQEYRFEYIGENNNA